MGIGDLQKLRHPYLQYTIEVYRGEIVEGLFGTIEQPRMDKGLMDVFASGKETTLKEGDVVRYILPLKARQECLKCHKNARIGDVLGLIDVRDDLTPILQEARKKLLFILIIISPLPILGAYIVARAITRRIEGPLGHLHWRIGNINRMNDLKNLEVEPYDFVFHEFNNLFREIGGLTRRLREIAVDKDMLEFDWCPFRTCRRPCKDPRHRGHTYNPLKCSGLCKGHL